ncbi:MAG TPA: hypothetical protein VEB64_09590 [Azospirillaceae bacterium]|nr:hypothetical protein [Azospirillaceae bacterium]
MDPWRFYNRLVLGVLGLMAAVVLPVAWWLEPLAGDLTRLGGYAENMFGPLAPHQRFHPPLARPGPLDQPIDVLVIGDSFSIAPPGEEGSHAGTHWADHLAALTGLTVRVIHQNRLDVWDYLGSELFRRHPPRVFLYETAERYINRRPTAPTAPLPSPHPAARPEPAPLPLRPRPEAPAEEVRPLHTPWTEPNFGEAVNYLLKAAARNLGADSTPAVVRALTRRGLFSCRQPGLALFIDEDFAPWKRDAALLNQKRSTLNRMRAVAEANGHTRFAALIAPDKATIYADHLTDPRPDTGVLDALDDGEDTLIRVDHPLRKAVNRGVRDVYLPNDTHWGTPGHRLVAETVVEHLRRRGILADIPREVRAEGGPE